MQKRSMITTGIVLLCMANLAWDFFDYTKGAQDFRKQEITKTAIKVAEQFEKIRNISQPEVLQKNLQALQEQEKIGFYIIKSEREPASSSLPDLVSPDFNAIIDGKVRLILDAHSELPQAAYVGEKINKHEIIIGKLIPQNYIATVMAYNRGNFWRNFLFQSMILILIISYSFRELSTLISRLQWGGIGSLRNKNTLKENYTFREAHSIASVMERISDQQGKGKDELEILRSQILPSLKHELSSTQEPPYEFDSIMVRVDINDSTKVYSNPEFNEIQHYWFDYFKVNCAEIATRYHGFVHEELGDEVILYFKISQEDIAACSAVACVRDIFFLSAEIDHQIQRKFDFSFRVKASLDQGRLRVFKSSFGSFDPLGENRRLKIEGAGGESRNPFLTTVRMLKFIEDKTVNSCVLSQKIFLASKKLLGKTLPVLHRIPGIEDNESYHWVTSFTRFEEVNEEFLLSYFRSDDSLVRQFETISSDLMTEDEMLKKLKIFRLPQLGRISTDLQKSYVKCLAALASQNQQKTRALATVISLAPNIMKGDVLEGSLTDLLSRCLIHSDDRVQANAIEAWGALDLHLSQIKQNLKAFRHNRSMANSLVVSLKMTLDKTSLKLLSKMLQNKDQFMRAAGCYALGEIIIHYQKADAVVLETNPILGQQMKVIKTLIHDSDPMVQRQAQKALAKF